MNLQVKYTTVPVNDPEKVKEFLMNSLGFKFWRKATSEDGEEGIITGLANEDENCLHLVQADDSHGAGAAIVINTDDCLRDYFELMSQGVKPSLKPHYTSSGLEFILSDSLGNQYIVLEERNYVEI